MQEISKIRKQIIQLIPIVNNGLLPTHVQTHMHALFLLLLERYYQLSYVHMPIERRIFTPRRLIDSYNDVDVKLHFRFNSAEQLRRIVTGFQLTQSYTLPSRHSFSGEEALLILLYRFHYPERYVDIEREFGRDYSTCCRIFQWMINFLTERWGYLLTNHMEYWVESLPLFCEKIRIKYEELVGPLPPEEAFDIFGFIDSTINAMCRPTQGLRDPGGAGVGEILNDVQRAFYTGYKKLHGLKWQTVGLPNGMIFHASGPYSARHNDAFLYGRSHIEHSLHQLQEDQEEQYRIMGDAAYGVTEYVSPLKNPKLRISIEWNYHEVKDYYQMVNYKRFFKVKASNIADMFLVALLLHNVHVSMNGSESSVYYQVDPPTFEDWIGADENP